MYSKFRGEQPCRSAISENLLCIFIEIILRYGCSPVNLLYIFRTPFPNTSGGLLLNIRAIAWRTEWKNKLKTSWGWSLYINQIEQVRVFFVKQSLTSYDLWIPLLISLVFFKLNYWDQKLQNVIVWLNQLAFIVKI